MRRRIRRQPAVALRSGLDTASTVTGGAAAAGTATGGKASGATAIGETAAGETASGAALSGGSLTSESLSGGTATGAARRRRRCAMAAELAGRPTDHPAGSRTVVTAPSAAAASRRRRLPPPSTSGGRRGTCAGTSVPPSCAVPSSAAAARPTAAAAPRTAVALRLPAAAAPLTAAAARQPGSPGGWRPSGTAAAAAAAAAAQHPACQRCRLQTRSLWSSARRPRSSRTHLRPAAAPSRGGAPAVARRSSRRSGSHRQRLSCCPPSVFASKCFSRCMVSTVAGWCMRVSCSACIPADSAASQRDALPAGAQQYLSLQPHRQNEVFDIFL